MDYKDSIKPIFDLAVGAICTASLAMPVMLVAAFNFADLRENPFHIDGRIGKDKKVFSMIKIKTMRTLYDENGKLLPDEERRTKFGQFLRHTGIDEFPQFFNVLIGNMSLVGPRPLSLKDAAEYTQDQIDILTQAKPGLTGPWQVFAIGRATTKQERIEKDASYVTEGITFKKDLEYMFSTLPSFVLGHDK